MAKPNVFISYAREDKRYFDHFLKLLKGHSKDLWNIWTDKEIPMGEDWFNTIKENVETCDFAILVVSPNFLQSDFIRDYELGEFMKKVEQEKNFKFFPVLLLPCDFTRFETIGKRQFFKPLGGDYKMKDKEAEMITFGELINFPSGVAYSDNAQDYQFVLYFVKEIQKALKKKLA
jgi:hypothetical protein